MDFISHAVMDVLIRMPMVLTLPWKQNTAAAVSCTLNDPIEGKEIISIWSHAELK